MHWEVEQKFRVTDLEAMRCKLQELGAKFDKPIEQTDHYFNHPARDFGRTDEALRLRQVGERNFITYKGPKVDAATKTRRELELPLPPGEKTQSQYAELLLALGFRSVATVTKTRCPGELTWSGHRVEVALDQVQDAGSFVELEIGASDDQLDHAKATLAELATKLGLSNSERRSYLELVLSINP